jgi:hypothetical protein
MQFYNQSQLFQLLINAAQRPGYTPDPVLQAAYNKTRLENAIRAIKTKNLLIYTEGSRPSVSLNSIFTIYTQPVGKRLILTGYSDNMRYGRISTAATGGPTDKVWPQQHRIRIVGKNPRSLIDDLVPSQAGVSGECRYTSPLLAVPEIIEPDEQIAVDLGYDSTAGTAPTVIEPQAFTFWTLEVKDKLTIDDEAAIADVKRAITAQWYQKAHYLNCVSLGLQAVHFATAAAGALASCDTQTVTAPMLVTGIGTNLVASKVKITDTNDGRSFSLDKFIQTSSLNMPDFQDQAARDLGAPVSAPIFTNFFFFPVPHLLKAGGQLHCDVINGGNAGGGAGSVVDPQDGQVIIFNGISV